MKAKKAPARRSTAARKAPARRAGGSRKTSVISRVVEQVRSTAGSIGSSVASMMPHRDVEEGGPTSESQRRSDWDDDGRS